MTKKELRDNITKKKENLTPEEISLYSNELTERFIASDTWKNATTLYAYISYNQEVLTRGIIEAEWTEKKAVAVPKVYEKSFMEFCYIKSFEELDYGYCKIKEPIHNNISNEDTALILMPGLAFDLKKQTWIWRWLL
jgi:5-formyltetrahydrofolate cyclo-ligase